MVEDVVLVVVEMQLLSQFLNAVVFVCHFFELYAAKISIIIDMDEKKDEK